MIDYDEKRFVSIQVFNVSSLLSLTKPGRSKLLRIKHMVKHQLLDENNNMEALKILFDELKYEEHRYKTDTMFLDFVSNQINDKLCPAYCANPDILHKMKRDYKNTLVDLKRHFRC
ncbi:unnamed protein product [Cochlearia groenlandica]